MRLKIFNKKLNLSKRKFNKFLLFNFLFFLIFKNSSPKNNSFKIKKVKLKDNIWLLNEND
tara:strand:- start:225 stop:404 length:180 start_codon:yes stop_codon:yes gene_type:complete